MKTFFLTLGLALAAFAQATTTELNCSDARFSVNGLTPYCEIREFAVPLGGSALAVAIEGSGTIAIQPWDGPGVQVSARVVAGGEGVSAAQWVASQVTLDMGEDALVSRGPNSSSHQTWNIHLDIRAPRGTALTLRSINGNIAVQDFDGKIAVSGTNGNVSLTRVSGDLSVKLVNGVIRIDVDRWRGQTIDAHTVNGSTEIDLPRDAAAHLSASTVAGSIVATLVSGKWSSVGLGSKLSVDIGGGGPSVHAETVTGSIRFQQPN